MTRDEYVKAEARAVQACSVAADAHDRAYGAYEAIRYVGSRAAVEDAYTLTLTTRAVYDAAKARRDNAGWSRPTLRGAR